MGWVDEWICTLMPLIKGGGRWMGGCLPAGDKGGLFEGSGEGGGYVEGEMLVSHSVN